MPDDEERTGIRLICQKFSGKKGPEYTRWRKEMLDAAEGKGDEDASWAQTLLGTDPQAGLTPAQNKRRTVRRRESYAQLVALIEDDQLKALLRAEALRNGRQAMIVLDRECQEPMTPLARNKKILEWHSLSIEKDVGIAPSSLTDFYRLLTSKNADFAAADRFSDDSIAEKFLGAIARPSAHRVHRHHQGARHHGTLQALRALDGLRPRPVHAVHHPPQPLPDRRHAR